MHSVSGNAQCERVNFDLEWNLLEVQTLKKNRNVGIKLDGNCSLHSAPSKEKQGRSLRFGARIAGTSSTNTMDDDHEDRPPENQSAAMLAAKEGRDKQLETYNNYVKGMRVDFKNHQGASFFEPYDASIYSKPKRSQRLNFSQRYKFFDAVFNSNEEEGTPTFTSKLSTQPHK